MILVLSVKACNTPDTSRKHSRNTTKSQLIGKANSSAASPSIGTMICVMSTYQSLATSRASSLNTATRNRNNRNTLPTWQPPSYTVPKSNLQFLPTKLIFSPTTKSSTSKTLLVPSFGTAEHVIQHSQLPSVLLDLDKPKPPKQYKKLPIIFLTTSPGIQMQQFGIMQATWFLPSTRTLPTFLKSEVRVEQPPTTT